MQDGTGIEADHTHFYPGATARVLPGAAPRDGALVVHFADGATASGTLAAETLTVAPYRTRAGTPIAARRWRIERRADGLRIAARLPA